MPILTSSRSSGLCRTSWPKRIKKNHVRYLCSHCGWKNQGTHCFPQLHYWNLQNAINIDVYLWFIWNHCWGKREISWCYLSICGLSEAHWKNYGHFLRNHNKYYSGNGINNLQIIAFFTLQIKCAVLSNPFHSTVLLWNRAKNLMEREHWMIKVAVLVAWQSHW